MSISLDALAIAQKELAAGVRGGNPVRFASPRIMEYLHSVGIASPAPWCAAAVHWCFMMAAEDAGLPNPCPRTGGALRMWELSPLKARTQLPAPGDVFVLDKGKGHGHVGFVLTASPDGRTLTTVEPDTNSAGSTTGDAWGTHLWAPADGMRGKLVGFLDFGTVSGTL